MTSDAVLPAAARILVLHGPNLNLLGTREPHIYGSTTLDALDRELRVVGESLGVQVSSRQSNAEGQLVEWIQEAGEYEALILNPGAYTHTSIAIRDALAALTVPAFEVHISNVYRREAFRHHSYCADLVVGRIVGFGTDGYVLALRGAVGHLRQARAAVIEGET